MTAALFLIALNPIPVVVAQTVWLSIIATENNINKAISTAHALHNTENSLEIIDTNDCQNLRKNLYVIASIDTQRHLAQKTIEKWRKRKHEDAYLRHCIIIQESRLALRIPPVDNSFIQNIIQPINWDSDEVITQLKFLNPEMAAIIKPHYQPDPEDIREGLKIRIDLLWLKSNQHKELFSDCIDPELLNNDQFLAVSCVTEIAADNLLHSTSVFSLNDGAMIFRQNRCREPKFTDNQLICQKETVDADGKLHHMPTLHVLPKSKSIN
ncbi:hypothetical protein [Nitrosomonas marina]|uniref:hypothetical protein n=1 Tax=Nitrosomonas marina TaxID=917 RepID=UPI00115FCCB3|nr:hypothetical protein [Nitrosomonas marina]